MCIKKMTNPFKLVAISLIPNFKFQEVLLSLKLLLNPGNYFDQKPVAKLEKELGDYLGRKHVHLFESGREAEYFLLKAMGIGETYKDKMQDSRHKTQVKERGKGRQETGKDEVIIQAFTCVAVPDPILWVGAKPVYADVDDSFNLDPRRLEAAISKNTKAVIFQDTFGDIGKIWEIRQICRKHGIPLIEDCAHGLGNEIRWDERQDTGDRIQVKEQEEREWKRGKTKKVGAVGEAAFFSFGRDKVISGVWGGAVATDSEELAKKIKAQIQGPRYRMQVRSRWWVARQLLYPGLIWTAVNTYQLFGIGKLLHKLFLSSGLITRAVEPGEKRGKRPGKPYWQLPGALAVLANSQLNKLNELIEHRKDLARYYSEQLGGEYDSHGSYLRYNIFVEDPKGLREFAAKQGVILGDWYDTAVAPKDVDLEAVGYKLGSCPRAEEVAGRIVNLPTNPNLEMSEARKVVKVVREFTKQKYHGRGVFV